MADLLYYYCGGQPAAVVELLVSLHSLLAAHPQRAFEIGIALDRESQQWLSPEAVTALPGCHCEVLTDDLPATQGKNVRHIVNRWRATRLFDYDRLLILDTDTLVNRPLEPLFAAMPHDPTAFTSYAGVLNSDRDWEHHRQYYAAAGEPYSSRKVYCRIGLHGFRRGWPYLETLIQALLRMDTYQGTRGGRRALIIDEYAVTWLHLAQRVALFAPPPALIKAPRECRMPPEQWPPVWHFLLGRTIHNPLWRQELKAAWEADFLGLRRLVSRVGNPLENIVRKSALDHMTTLTAADAP